MWKVFFLTTFRLAAIHLLQVDDDRRTDDNRIAYQ